MKISKLFIALIISVLIIAATMIILPKVSSGVFDEDQAMSYVEAQTNFGPRTPGSEGHAAFIPWASGILEEAGWYVELQKAVYKGHEITNILATRKSASILSKWIVLGAHYDSRIVSDHDPDQSRQSEPCPGANDGASGVAVLLELAQIIPADFNKKISIALFDAEDQGDLVGWHDWCIGSEYMAKQMSAESKKPDAVIVLDMIGDEDLNIYREINSDRKLTDEIWKIAKEEGLEENFPDKYKYKMEDDHIPFIKNGIPAADLIDFDYPYWHTTSDTSEHVSQGSLAKVGNVILSWLKQ